MSVINYQIAKGESRDLVIINQPNAAYHIIQETESTLRVHLIYVSKEETEAQWEAAITVEQNGENCRTELYGMGLLHGKQQTNLLTNIVHNVGNGYSSQMIKLVLDDSAKATFRGELKIMPDAQKVEAYQTNRNILLSKQAEVITEPQLEIYADDVKASHGATTGQLDETALFYMQQRCIDRDTAAKLLLYAFFDEVIKTLAEEAVQEEIAEQINQIL